MKKRILSTIVILTIFITVLVINSKLFGLLMLTCGILSLRELIDVKYKKKDINLVKIISYVSALILIINGLFYTLPTLLTLIIPILGLLIPIVFYNDNKKYNVEDALYLIGITFFIGFAFNIIVYLRQVDISKCVFIFLIACVTDTYAYIGGSLIGKHKLTSISPKKTWEGSIIGSIAGVIIGSVYYYAVIGNLGLLEIVLLSFILTILSEIGDLVFSSIKRYFNIKDYSNLIPGHGGMLDRFDSIIFVALGYALILTII